MEREETQTVGPRRLARRQSVPAEPLFSICTMVTNWAEYDGMRSSFVAGGFDPGRCEYLTIDNSQGNIADSYVATNEFLQAARAPYIVLCHQDVLLLEDGAEILERCLSELHDRFPRWAIAGNAGITGEGWPVTCISDPGNSENIYGSRPAEVVSLDENFLVIRREANLAVSRDLGGFHHYGTDLCVIADILGWSAHVIDFFLRHNSTGTVDQRYFASAAAVRQKYARAFRPRWVPTIIGEHLFLAGGASAVTTRLALLRRVLKKLIGHLPRNRDLWGADRFSSGTRHKAALEKSRQ